MCGACDKYTAQTIKRSCAPLCISRIYCPPYKPVPSELNSILVFCSSKSSLFSLPKPSQVTMHFTAATLASIVGAVSAKTIRIDAGEGGLTFEPANTQAEEGDMLEFHFYPQKHSVVMGNPDMPCHPAEENGFYSGFHPTQDGEAVS